MGWQLRHEGSPKVVKDRSFDQIVAGLRDGQWATTDEVLGPGETQWRAIEVHPQLAEIAEEVETPPPPRHDEATNLDMNALIDVCLVLLIFFILTTSYAATVQKVVPVPIVKQDENTKVKVLKVEDVKKRMIRVQAVLEQGRPVLRVENQTVDALTKDGTDIDPDKVAAALRPFVRSEDHKTEVLLDARGITWGSVIAIQDGAKGAGVQIVHHLMRKHSK